MGSYQIRSTISQNLMFVFSCLWACTTDILGQSKESRNTKIISPNFRIFKEHQPYYFLSKKNLLKFCYKMLSCNKTINVLKTFKNLNIKFMQFLGLHYLANNKTCNFSFHMLIDQGVYYFYPTSIHYKPFLRLLVFGVATVPCSRLSYKFLLNY